MMMWWLSFRDGGVVIIDAFGDLARLSRRAPLRAE